MKKVSSPALPSACLIFPAVCREVCSLAEGFQSYLLAELKSTHTAAQAKVLAVKAVSMQAKGIRMAAANLYTVIIRKLRVIPRVTETTAS